ncbi:hypothetical protein, partial [Aquibaculum arenosum]
RYRAGPRRLSASGPAYKEEPTKIRMSPMTKGFPRGALRALLLRGLLLCGALAPLPLAAEAPSGSWMRLDSALIELASLRIARLAQMRQQHDKHYWD